MSSFLLKIVAIITMTIDHIGLAFFNSNLLLRTIGRIAMPIFAFQIGVGFRKTHSKLKYILRMFTAALISQIPFSLMLKYSNFSNFSLNICFTFTFALLVLYFIDLGKNNKIFYLISLFLILRKSLYSNGLWYFCNTFSFTFLLFSREKDYSYNWYDNNSNYLLLSQK